MLKKKLLDKVIYPLLAAKALTEAPSFPNNKCSPDSGGRSLREGADRAWSLECGTAPREIQRDPLFRRGMALARGRSVVDYRRRMNIFLLIRFYLSALPSRNIIELGTWKGGNLLFMASVLRSIDPSAVVYGLDTFAGMPDTDHAVDLHRKGDFADTSMEEIQSVARDAGLNNIVLIKGDIRETLPNLRGDVSFGLAHIDLDIYDPIRFAQTELIAHLLVPGAYLVYDDALVSSCPGATMAVEELIRAGKSSEQIYPHFVFRA